MTEPKQVEDLKKGLAQALAAIANLEAHLANEASQRHASISELERQIRRVETKLSR